MATEALVAEDPAATGRRLALGKIQADAAEGFKGAQFALAMKHLKGLDGVNVDHVKAVDLLRSAADKGHVLAQSHLGDCYLNGHGVEKDEQEAARLHRLAAQAGNAVAIPTARAPRSRARRGVGRSIMRNSSR